MLLLICLVLLFSADPDTLQHRHQVERVQLQYSTLLQRYLKLVHTRALILPFIDIKMHVFCSCSYIQGHSVRTFSVRGL